MVLQKSDLCKHFTAFDLSHSFQIMLKKKEVYFDVCVCFRMEDYLWCALASEQVVSQSDPPFLITSIFKKNQHGDLTSETNA